MIEPEQIHEVSEKGKHQILTTNILYLALTVVFLTLGGMLQMYNFNIGIIVTEYGIVFLPALIWAIVNRVNLKEQFHLKVPQLSVFVKVFCSTLLFVPFTAMVNALIIMPLMYFFNVTPPEIPTGEGNLGFLVSMLLISITPGICEEFLFRGLIFKNYERKYGFYTAMAMSAFLFGIFHYNIFNLFGPIFLGVVFAYLVYITKSIYVAMFAHAVNNGFAVVMMYVAKGLEGVKRYSPATTAIETTPEMATAQWIGMIIGMLFVLCFVVGTFMAGLFIMKSLRRQHLRVDDEIGIQSKTYRVLAVENSQVKLTEVIVIENNENTLCIEADESRVETVETFEMPQIEPKIIETTSKKIFEIPTARLLKQKTEKTWFPKMTFGEALPLILSVVIYLGYNILVIIALMGKG